MRTTPGVSGSSRIPSSLFFSEKKEGRVPREDQVVEGRYRHRDSTLIKLTVKVVHAHVALGVVGPVHALAVHPVAQSRVHVLEDVRDPRVVDRLAACSGSVN